MNSIEVSTPTLKVLMDIMAEEDYDTIDDVIQYLLAIVDSKN